MCLPEGDATMAPALHQTDQCETDTRAGFRAGVGRGTTVGVQRARGFAWFSLVLFCSGDCWSLDILTGRPSQGGGERDWRRWVDGAERRITPLDCFNMALPIRRSKQNRVYAVIKDTQWHECSDVEYTSATSC